MLKNQKMDDKKLAEYSKNIVRLYFVVCAINLVLTVIFFFVQLDIFDSNKDGKLSLGEAAQYDIFCLTIPNGSFHKMVFSGCCQLKKTFCVPLDRR